MGLFDSLHPDMEKALHLVVRYLGNRPRSEKEINDYLKKKQYDKKIISKIIALLKRHDYLNDETFARLFVESRKRRNPKSKFALGYELKQKGISSHIRETVLKDYKDNHMAIKALGSKLGQWQHLDLEKKKKKALNYLRYRGFGYDVCMAAWQHFLGDMEGIGSQNDHRK